MKLRHTITKPGRSCGVTIIEFMAFLGLAAVVIAGIFAIYGSTRNSATVSDLTTTANSIVMSLRATFPRGIPGGTLDVTELKAAGTPKGWDGGWQAYTGAAGGGVLNRGSQKIWVSASGGVVAVYIYPGSADICNNIKTSNLTVGEVTIDQTQCAASAETYLRYTSINVP